MKTNFTLSVVIVSLFTSFIVSAQVPDATGIWNFDNSEDLLKAIIGNDLTLEGDISAVSGPTVENMAAEIPLGSYLTMAHGIAPNGGGTLVNEWTLQIDFSVAALDTWYAFFQTLDGDADLFVAKTENTEISRVPNSIGCGSTLYSADIISADTWYRMVVSVKNGDEGFFKIFVDGTLWLDSPSQALDGRYGLRPDLLIFQDDDGDDGPIMCSELAIWDVALSDDQALSLGDATHGTLGIRNNEAKNTSNLGQNFPNPFTLSTTFRYEIKEAGNVAFHVFDVTGKEVFVTQEGRKLPGNYEFNLNSENLTKGIYYFQMKENNNTSSRKIVIY